MNDLISVIVPVYNAEAYIERCIESILNQSYEYFELILVNDGSVDNSLEICKEFASKDNRIVVLDRPNGGASAARNMGLSIMRGKYIVFVDSDDYVSPSYLENLYFAAKHGQYDIVQCNLERTKKLKKILKKVIYKQTDIKELTKEQALNERMYYVTIPGKIYSSNIFKDFKFKEGIIYEDDASYYIFIDRAQKLGKLNETLYFYYMSENSVMRNNKKDKSDAFINIYEERIKYFKENGEKELLEGSYDRFCLVLMLNLLYSYKYANNVKDRKKWITLFNRYYPLVIKSHSVFLKDKVMFSIFKISPKLVVNLIVKLRKWTKMVLVND